MALYLGSNNVDIIKSVNTPSPSADYDPVLTSMINKTITSYSNSTISIIGAYAFANCVELSEIDIPNCIEVGASAFSHCIKLSSVNLPNCVSVRQSAFCGCLSLTNISLPNCEYISISAFVSTKLTDVSFPKCKHITNAAFANCYSLTTINCPNLQTAGYYAFEYCSALNTVSFPICSSIYTSCFANCYNLISLYLNSVSTVTRLGGANAFSSTPIGGYTTSTGGIFGSVFVPASLYSDFIIASYWSDIADRIVSV